MTILLHATQICIFLTCAALSKTLMNVYVIVRLYGSVPTRTRRRYEREFIAFCVLAIATAVLVVASVVAVEVVW